MSDDEEVVLSNSELCKYMETNRIYNPNNSFVDTESHLENCKAIQESTNISAENDCGLLSCKNRKFVLPENSQSIIYSILKTGLLYPDHIFELENSFQIENIKEGKSVKYSTTIYCSCVFASSIFFTVNRNYQILRCLCLAAATYFSYKVSAAIKMHNFFNKVKRFTVSVEQLFSATKKTLSFISESEFLLRSKITKDQQFYIPNNGWVNSNTAEGLEYSGLILPELRKMLLCIYIETISVLEDLLRFMRTVLSLKTDFDSDSCSLEPLEEYKDLCKQSKSTPNNEDLKKLHNMYLVTQSECLKRLILCFVEDLWTDNASQKKLKLVIEKVVNCAERFTMNIKKLELLYQKCINERQNDVVKFGGNSTLKSKHVNDKIYIFIRNFLTKADAHVLSLLLDLRMINDWINEFEENNKNNTSDYSVTLITTLHDKLQLMKSNIHCFTNLYNDNCNILKDMLQSNEVDSSNNGVKTTDETVNNCTRLTGIEVGKSNFDIICGDEVLISLSNIDNTIDTSDHWNGDNDDLETQKCLPKNVLDELKFALKGKKKEWLEREKKATLNSNITIDNLDCDNLLNSNVNNSKTQEMPGGCSRYKYSHRVTSFSDSSDEDCGLLVSSNSVNGDPLHTQDKEKCDSNAFSDLPTDDNSDKQKISMSQNSSITGGFDENVIPRDCNFSSQNSFANQIRIAQKSFNLGIQEEEFVEESSNEIDSEDL